MRHRLFDREAVIQGILVYSTLIVILGALYLLLVRSLGLLAPLIMPEVNEDWVGWISALAVGLAFYPLRARLLGFIDRHLYPDQQDFLDVLPAITERLPSCLLAGELAGLMTEELPARLHLQRASLLVLDTQGGRYASSTGEDDLSLPAEHPLVAALQASKAPIQRTQPPANMSSEALNWLEEHGFELTIPLIVNGDLLGIYHLGPRATGRRYRRAEVQLLAVFGGQAAIGLQYDRLYQAEREQRLHAEQLAERMTGLLDGTNRRATQLEAINAIIAVAVAAPDLPRLLDGMLDLILDALGQEAGGLLVAGQLYNRGMPEVFLRYSLQITQSVGWIGSSTVVVKDWLEVEDIALASWSERMIQAGIRSTLIVPVMAVGVHLGVLALAAQHPQEWQDEDVALVKALVRQLGSAIERLDLLAKTQEQARQVQQIVDTVPEGVILLDQDLQILVANPAARRYLDHLTHDEHPGQMLSKLAGQSLRTLLDSMPGKPWHELVSERAPHRIYEMAARPLDEPSQTAGWVLVLRDVTLERENQAQAQMQERLATVGQLAAGIAHDFNNIMAAIQVYVDLFSMEDRIAPKSRERLEIIRNQIGRATSLIRQILDFSRSSVMEESMIDLLLLMKELEKMLRRLLPENIRVELQNQPGEYTLKADPTRLQQVFLNLSLNARDAMPTGGVLRFELSSLALAPGDQMPYTDLIPGNWIQIRVSDTGMGIPPSILPHVFDPFFTTKQVGQGTGLGLAQVFGIIKGHGGSIDLRSEEGKGTEFIIYLPQRAAEKPHPPQDLPIESITGAGETILVAEDDPATRDAMRVLLESLNYRVLTASNGKEALQIYRRARQSIALVVSDIIMPEMGGIPLYHALKEEADPQPANMLFVTGHPLDPLEWASEEAGRVDWLNKPFSAQEFAAAVRKALGKRLMG